MKKYYGYFVYDGEEYVIRFKLKGSLQWSERFHCFMDKDWYTRSYSDLICYAALDRHPLNDKAFECAYGLSHEGFRQQRARGVKRWNPKIEIIEWD